MPVKKNLPAIKFRLYLAAVATMMLLPVVRGQEVKCSKAKVRANRHRTIAFVSIAYNGRIWEENAETIVQLQLPNGDDSIAVLGTDHQPMGFHARSGEIKETRITYRRKDEWLTDSINKQQKGAEHGYYSIFRSRNVVATYNGKDHSTLWYDINGRDSVYERRYDNGVLQHMEWYDRGGEVRSQKDWSSQGILKQRKVGDTVSEYRDDGILYTQMFDTTILGRKISCRRHYYENGVLEREAFYYYNMPCNTWRFYDRDGRLLSKLKQTSIQDLERVYTIAAAKPEPEIYTTVEEMADYPGGNQLLRKHIEERLPEVLCMSEGEMRGIYTVSIRVGHDDGKAEMTDIMGINATLVKPAMQQMIGNLLKWHRGRINGRPVDELMTMTLIVE